MRASASGPSPGQSQEDPQEGGKLRPSLIPDRLYQGQVEGRKESFDGPAVIDVTPTERQKDIGESWASSPRVAGG